MGDTMTMYASPCHECGYAPDAGGMADLRRLRNTPSPGQIVMCMACGALAIIVTFDDEGMIARVPTPAEHAAMLADPYVVHIIESRARVARMFPDWPFGQSGSSSTEG